MLALLQSLLENLRLSGSGGGGGQANNPQNKALSDAIQGLGDLMGKQRGLLDKTFRGQQGEAVKPKDLQKEQGDIAEQAGRNPERSRRPEDSGAQRSRPRRPFDGPVAAGSGRERSARIPAIDQKNALDAMRSAATDLANQLMKQMGQNQGKQATKIRSAASRARTDRRSAAM